MRNIRRILFDLDPLQLLIAAFIGLVLSLPLTGFIYGLFACTDCGWGLEGFIGRLWIGVVHSFLNVITLGKPWENEGGTSSVNLRPFVVLVCFISTYIAYQKLRGRVNQ